MTRLRRLLLAAALAAVPGPLLAQEPEPEPEPAAEAAVSEAAPPLVTLRRDETDPPRTLMFTLKERLSIEAALREGGLNRGETGEGETAREPLRPRLRQPLYLSGLLYQGPGEWTIWINGQALRPGETGHLFSVADVDDRAVTLAVAWGETTRLVRLEPHQTFLPAFSTVVEGKAY